MTRIFFFCLSLLASLAVFGEPASKSLAKHGGQQSYDSAEFDLQRESIPPMYGGHDAWRIYQALMSAPIPKKGTYETTTEFNERTAAWLRRPLYGGLRGDGLLAFGAGQLGFKLDYDADTERQTLENFSPPYVIPDQFNWFSIVRWNMKQLAQGIGVNFSGNRVRYERGEVSSFTVKLENMRAIDFPLPRERARSMMATGQLFIGKLATPYFFSTENLQKPTLRSPQEIRAHFNGILIRVEEVWFYEMRSGLVYQKVKL